MLEPVPVAATRIRFFPPQTSLLFPLASCHGEICCSLCHNLSDRYHRHRKAAPMLAMILTGLAIKKDKSQILI